MIDSYTLRNMQCDRDMPSGLSVFTEPTIEPVTLAEAKAHCRVRDEMTEDNDLINGLITAARMHIEDTCGLAMINQTLDYALEEFPYSDEIRLPRMPVSAITSITYTDADGVAGTLAATNYRLVVSSRPPKVVLTATGAWPTAILRPGLSAVIRFVAGYGTAAANVRRPVRQALLMLVGHWYENREASSPVGRLPAGPMPLAVESLLISNTLYAF